jgi:hypothetical protein
MSRWFRVFGTSSGGPQPAALLEHLQGLGFPVTGRFQGDDLGWFRAELSHPEAAAPLALERYLSSEEGIRAELNTWAAWLESTGEGPVQTQLLQHMISTTQVFTLGPIDPGEIADLDGLCLAVCRFLALATAGVYQVDGEGFFAADGSLLVPEDAA